MDYLALDAIMSGTLPEQDVDVPDWGGTIKVRAITNSELARCKAHATNKRNGDLDEVKFNALVLVAGCVEPEFPPASEMQIMRQLTPGPVARIANVIMDLSGFSDEDEDDDSGEA